MNQEVVWEMSVKALEPGGDGDDLILTDRAGSAGEPTGLDIRVPSRGHGCSPPLNFYLGVIDEE